jgi:hypothetical protein
MEARLTAIPDRRIIGAFNATGNANAGANSVEAVVPAFNEATGAALSQVIDWALRTPRRCEGGRIARAFSRVPAKTSQLIAPGSTL